MSSWIDTIVSPILSHLDVSEDESTPLDGSTVPLVTALLPSTVVGKGVDGGGLSVSVELLLDQHSILCSRCMNCTHLEFVYGTDEDVGDSRGEVPIVSELLAPDDPADELVSGRVGDVHVAGGTELSSRLAGQLPKQLIPRHVPWACWC